MTKTSSERKGHRFGHLPSETTVVCRGEGGTDLPGVVVGVLGVHQRDQVADRLEEGSETLQQVEDTSETTH